jgi:tRNA (adenine22-N1)-methyltransferase
LTKLSDRLAAIANFIQKGDRVADIGTDHGLLPIFLYKESISPKVILCDIKPGPLEKAKRNISVYAPGMIADIRLGSGLQPVGLGEVDAAVIAGMGGEVISEILARDPLKTKSIRTFILQPRNAKDKLRIWLYRQGYTIAEEKLVREGRFICEIIVVDTTIAADLGKRGNTIDKKSEDLDFEISPLLLLKKDPLQKELIECRIKTEEKIISSIRENGSLDSQNKIKEKEMRIEKLRKIYNQA